MSGKVAKVNVKVGDKIKAGKTMASLKNSDVSASVSQARAGVDNAKAVLDAQRARLDELKTGTRLEDIQLSEIRVQGAKESLADAEEALTNAQNKAAKDLEQTLSDAVNSASRSITTATNSLIFATDLQYSHYTSGAEGTLIAGNKASAINILLGDTGNGGLMASMIISQLNGGAKLLVSQALLNPTEVNIVNALNQTLDGLNKTKATLDSFPIDGLITTTEKANLSLEKSYINTEISTISGKLRAISSQKALSTSTLSSAQTQVNIAKSNLSLAEQELNIKKAGATTGQISAQEAAVRQAEASLASAKAMLASASANYSKTILNSIISGTVTKVGIKAGEITSTLSPAISVMRSAKLQAPNFK